MKIIHNWIVFFSRDQTKLVSNYNVLGVGIYTNSINIL